MGPLATAFLTVLPLPMLCSAKVLDLPASVLIDDDLCLGESQCGTAFVQHSNGQRRASSQPSKEASENQVASKARNTATATATATATTATAAATASLLLSDIRQLLSKENAEQDIRQAAEQYAKLLEAEVVPSIESGHREHGKLLQTHVQAFERCDADLKGRIETGDQLKALSSEWTKLQKACRDHQHRLDKGVSLCNEKLIAAERQKEKACEALKTANETELLQLKQSCEGLSQSYLEQKSICAENKRFFDIKFTECESLQRSMHSANCARASQVSGICDMYELCRAGMAVALKSAKETIDTWKNFHKAEWTAVATMRCFVGTLKGGETQATSSLPGKLRDCEELVEKNSTQFDQLAMVSIEDVPAALPCTPVNDSPCMEELSSPSAKQLAIQRSKVAYALSADSAEIPEADAVSFVQEGIEKATGDVLRPVEMQKAFFAPLATPITMMVVGLTMMMLMVRCMMFAQTKREERAQAAASGNLAVDAWCVNSHDTSGNLEGGVPEKPGPQIALLCPELIVPRNTRCVVSFPRLTLGEGNLSQSVIVADKMGQPLFYASLAREVSCSDRIIEKLLLSRQDGTVLISCQLVLPQGSQKSRGKSKCNVLQSDGKEFATLLWESPKVGWFSRLSNQAASSNDSAFVLSSAVKCSNSSSRNIKPWQLRVSEGQTGTAAGLSVVDEHGRPVAVAELGKVDGNDLGGFARDSFRLEVSSLQNVDLGLATVAILAVDRLREVCEC